MEELPLPMETVNAPRPSRPPAGIVYTLGRFVRRMVALGGSDMFWASLLVFASIIVGAGTLFVWLDDSCLSGTDFWHSASVALATGHGFHATVPQQGSDLWNFLSHNRVWIDPEQVAQATISDGAEGFQVCHRYLFYLIAAAWWLLGVSWHVIFILQIFILCITTVIAYGLFRLAMRPLVSAAGAMSFMASPLGLSILMRSRDFNKAPFILGSILIMGLLARRTVSLRKYMGLAVLLGIVTGIGLGFRQDMLLCVIPSVLVLAVCPREKPRALLQRAGAIVLMLSAWALTASPILVAMYYNPAQTAHSIVGGLTSSSDMTLGVPVDSYQLFRANSDTEISLGYSSLASRTQGEPPIMSFFTMDAERRAKRLLLEVAETFPADLLNRAYAATLWILGGNWTPWKPGHAGAIMNTLVAVENALAHHFAQYRFAYIAFVVLAVAGRSLRTASILFFIAMYFCCTTSIQFETRHCFHLVVLPLWLMAFALDKLLMTPVLLATGWKQMRHARPELLAVLRGHAKRAVLFAVGACVVILAPLYATRLYQSWQMGKFIARCNNAILEPIPTEIKPARQPGYTLFSPVDWPQADLATLAKGTPEPSTHYMRTEYLVAEFQADTDKIAPSIEYAADDPPKHPFFAQWLSGPTLLHLHRMTQPGPVKFFFPVYEMPRPPDGSGWNRFSGFTLPASCAGSFKGLYRVKNLQDFRLLPDIVIPADTSLMERYRTLPLWAPKS